MLYILNFYNAMLYVNYISVKLGENTTTEMRTYIKTQKQ